MTIYKTPDWLYKPAKINSNLYSSIRKELVQLFMNKFKGIPLNEIRSQFCVPCNVDDVKRNCPALMAQLTEYNLADELKLLAFIIVAPDDEYPIHVDTLNPGQLSIGLNIPVLNCHDSYTAWYDTEILYHEFMATSVMDRSTFSSPISTAIPCDTENAVEIDRCSANYPHWITVVTPHAAVCNHKMLRVNSSLRFDKKIFEMIADGSFMENCVGEVISEKDL